MHDVPMVANALLLLDPLPNFQNLEETKSAARRLQGAHDSVQGLFQTLHSAREQKITGGRLARRLEHGEVDLLRAAIVFAGAGLDAVLRQLVRDALPSLLGRPGTARKNMAKYASELVEQEPGKAKRLLSGQDVNLARQDAYVEKLTSGSLQSESDLKKVRDALGLPVGGHFTNAALEQFRDFFDARNTIVHELDLKHPNGRGDSTRRARNMAASRNQANEAFSISAQFIDQVERLL